MGVKFAAIWHINSVNTTVGKRRTCSFKDIMLGWYIWDGIFGMVYLGWYIWDDIWAAGHIGDKFFINAIFSIKIFIEYFYSIK
jgi:hypothetical protein